LLLRPATWFAGFAGYWLHVFVSLAFVYTLLKSLACLPNKLRKNTQANNKVIF